MLKVRETKSYTAEGGIARTPYRSRQARFLHAQREALIAQCEGQPSPLDAIKIERLTRLLLQFEESDGRDVTAEQLARLDADLTRHERLFGLLDHITGSAPVEVAA